MSAQRRYRQPANPYRRMSDTQLIDEYKQVLSSLNWLREERTRDLGTNWRHRADDRRARNRLYGKRSMIEGELINRGIELSSIAFPQQAEEDR